MGTIAEMSSPVHLFADEMCELGPHYRADKKKLYDRYDQWRIDRGFPLVDLNVFSRNLYAAFPRAISQVRLTVEGERPRCFGGIKLLDKHLTSDDDRVWSRGMDVVSSRTSGAAEPSIEATVKGAKVTSLDAQREKRRRRPK